VKPDGLTVASEFAPSYPLQREDISYGSGLKELTLVSRGSPLKFTVPSDDSLALTWTGQDADFDDSGWTNGVAGVGYESSDGPLWSIIDTDIAGEMKRTNPGAFFRFPFSYEAGDRHIVDLNLSVTIDDGFVAYLNGVEVGCFGKPSPLAWNSSSASTRDDEEVLAEPIVLDLGAHADGIVDGTNVLAIHGMTAVPGNADFALDLTLTLTVENRSGHADYAYFRTPTPGAPNGPSFSGFASPPSFSALRGFYDGPFRLVVDSPDSDSTIRFTTDGSLPDVGSQVYRGPIRIADTTVLRASVYRPGYEPSEVITHSYFFGNEAIRSLPVLSLVTKRSNLWGPTGIMEIHPRNTTMKGIAWERPVSAELLEPGGGGFAVSCGMRLGGSDGNRAEYDPNLGPPFSKYSFRLYFRGSYGPPTLKYPLFGDYEVEEFDKIALRAGNSDHTNPFLIDELMRRLQIATGNVGSRGTFVNLFLNGEYQGYYNPTERIDDEFLRSHYGGENDWDIIAQGGDVRDGDAIAWNQLMAHVNSTDQVVLRNYRLTAKSLDIDNFIDYLLVEIYGGNGDWPQNNVRVARERVSGAKFRCYVWDAEFSLGNGNRSVFRNPLTEELGRNVPIAILYRQLLSSPEFRLRFADRIHRHFFNGGALTGERILALFEEMRDELAGAIPNMNTTIPDVWIPDRQRVLMGHFSRAGLLRSGNAPVFTPHGGVVRRGFNLWPTNLSGDIYVTTDGTDPHLLQGGVSPTARRISGSRQDVNLFGRSATWKFLDDGSDLGGSGVVEGSAGFGPADWKHADFDDDAWASGPAPLGYGRIGDISIETPVSYGGIVGDRHVTTYFRRSFDVAQAHLFTSLRASLLKDDGAIVYLNGREAARANMPGHEVSADTLATANLARGEDQFESIDLDPTALVEGANVLAVEVHQGTNRSSDLAFALSLEGKVVVDASAVVRIDSPAVIKARSLDPATGEWSALTEAFFSTGVAASAANLAISEIHYRPLSPSAAEFAAGFEERSEFEFVELMNIGNEHIDLATLAFVEGVRFELDGDTDAAILAPGDRALLVNNRAAFQMRYPAISSSLVIGEFSGSLNNDGEALLVLSEEGDTIRALTFNDKFPWPEAADGDGFSLVLIDPRANPNHDDPANWRPSVAIGGTPGGSDATPFTAAPLEDLDQDGLAALLEYALGTSDTIPDPGPPLAVTVARADTPAGQDSLLLSYRRNLAADEARLAIEISEDLQNWRSASGRVEHVDSAHNGDGTSREHFRVTLDGTPMQFFRLRASTR